MYFIKWVTAFILWSFGVFFIPGLIGGLLFSPFYFGLSAIVSFGGDNSTIILSTLISIYGLIFLLGGYYIYIFYSEKFVSKFLNLPYLNISKSLGIKKLFSDIKNKPKVKTRFIVCNIILITWSIASVFGGAINNHGLQFMFTFSYYFCSLFIIVATLIYFSTSLREEENEKI
jgi:hypothetical protein